MKYLVSRHLVFSILLPWALISIPGRPGCHGTVCSCTVFPWQPAPLGTLSRSASKSVWLNLRWSRGSINVLNNAAILSRGDARCRCVWCVGSVHHSSVSDCRRIVCKKQHRGIAWPLKRFKRNCGVETVYVFHMVLHVSGFELAAPSLNDLEQ